MNKRQQWLLLGCQVFNIDIELDYIIKLKEGEELHTTALISSMGGKNGMIIVNSYDKVKTIWDDLIKENYGIAVLGEPSEKSKFNLEACKEMFIDWGWNPPA